MNDYTDLMQRAVEAPGTVDWAVPGGRSMQAGAYISFVTRRNCSVTWGENKGVGTSLRKLRTSYKLTPWQRRVKFIVDES